jgi:hypothetical protein
MNFLLIFSPTPKNKNCCGCFSLKTANQLLPLFSFSLLSFGLYLDIKYRTDTLMYILFKHFFYDGLIIISGIYMYNSTLVLNYKKAYIGLVLLNLSFYLHFIILLINFILSTNFTSINYYKMMNSPTRISFTVLQILYIIYEVFYIWIAYCYTKHLQQGNDALVDGQNFNRYIENLASNDTSRISSPKNSHLNFDLRSKGDFTSNIPQNSSLRNQLNVN